MRRSKSSPRQSIAGTTSKTPHSLRTTDIAYPRYIWCVLYRFSLDTNLGGGTLKSMNRKAHGFTIVELLIVIVVIAILAAISVAAYTNIQERAKTSRRNSEMAQLLKAITLARTATGKTLGEITGSYASISACVNTGPNPDGLEPKDLLKTSSCWARYYINLDKISAASGVDLSSFRDGDARGNPYMWDENEGEGGNYCSTDGQIRYFIGNGINHSNGLAIPKLYPTC